MENKVRLLILIVAYNVEKQISWVLERIPEEIPQNYDVEVLIIDNASPDNTFAIALREKHRILSYPVTVLQNPTNLGYGGNQKVGYQYAILHNFDLVALLHGDGQYAPEMLPQLLEPLVNDQADMVMGSRMLKPRDALKGGMPLYKFVGNRILTTYQNWLLGTSLSEFHSGYRVYRVDVLRELPFELNSNDFHFDTEILIQHFFAQKRVLELPIPTYYGDEICHVNGLLYAWNIFRTTFHAWKHKKGLLYERKYACLPVEYDLKWGYPSSHTFAYQTVREGSKVLDIGCGSGELARKLKEKGCTVVGLDKHPPKTQEGLEEFHQWEFHQPFPVKLSDFDYVLLLDVLQHHPDPFQFLQNLREACGIHRPTFVISVPNVVFLPLRFRFLFGQFRYTSKGILEVSHRYFFTVSTLREFLRQNHFLIHRLQGIAAPFPKVLGKLGVPLTWIHQLACRLWKSLFSYQIFAVAEPTPTLPNQLRHTLTHSEEVIQKMQRERETG